MSQWWDSDLPRAGSISANTWYNVVTTYDGTTKEIFINNVSFGTNVPGVALNVPIGNGVYIGRISNGGYQFGGKMALVQVWNVSLTSTQRTTNFNTYRSRYGL
jgi:hypothetical protein